MVILENSKKKVLFLNEYRRGIRQKSLGSPGGHIEKKENPLDCVKRELYEETGQKAKNWKLLFSYVRHGTYYCGKDYIYSAKVIKNKTKSKFKKIQLKGLNIEDIIKNLEKNKFKTAGIIASILFYAYKTKNILTN